MRVFRGKLASASLKPSVYGFSFVWAVNRIPRQACLGLIEAVEFPCSNYQQVKYSEASLPRPH